MVLKKQKFLNTSQEQYERIMAIYNTFLDAMNDPNQDPVSPYFPLPQKTLDELELIREVSRELQKKKDEDINKAAQAAKEEAEAIKTETEEVKQEEKTE